MTFETIADKPFTKQELLNRKLNVVHAKVKTAEELSETFALFCILATVDLNIEAGETSTEWLIIFIIVTSLLVVCNVLVKICIMYVTPRLETALFMSRYDIKEFDLIVHDDLISYMEYVWIAASIFSSFLFGINFICIVWVKFQIISKNSAVGATAIMAPVIVICLLFAIVTYTRIRRRNRQVLFNENEITSGSTKVHYSKRIQTNTNNSHVANSRWGLIRAHVYRENESKMHNV